MKDRKTNNEASIAIIGMACVYPGAHSPEELWQNVLAGRRFFRKMPDERMPRSLYFDADPDAPGKTYCDQMAVITDWIFDPVRFRMAPVVVNASDIAHWLALWTAEKALADAGLGEKTIDSSRTGVILGNTLTGEFSRSHSLKFRWPYVERVIRRVLSSINSEMGQTEALLKAIQYSYESPLPEINEDSLAGNMSNTIVGRICNHFNLGAGGYTVDGACSSSLLSIIHACQALKEGDMDLALAGGVDISLDPFEIVGFAKTRALASDDIRPYDEAAAGMLTGEGCGIIVLTREENARKHGYPIRALIRGWGYSSDGRGGITAPEVEGQVRALQKTYERAGYPISSVGLFEGHGTGTALGDRVEIKALRRLLDAESGDSTCRIGSIKANIGHCKAAAGAAGVIKAVMSLSRKILPPTMNCTRPNPEFSRPPGRLQPLVNGMPWTNSHGPRRASVSSMGFGGANSHLALEEAEPHGEPFPEDLMLLGSDQQTELLLLAAEDPDDLKKSIQKLLPITHRISRAELIDLTAALAALPMTGNVRLAIVTESPWHLEKTLQGCLDQLASGASIDALNDPSVGIFAASPIEAPRCIALFPGQGSQHMNMGAYFFKHYPFVRELYEQADAALKDFIPGGLTSKFLATPFTLDLETSKDRDARLRDTRIAQPAILLCTLAILRVLRFLGMEPDLAIGHSLGEIAALHTMGACDETTALCLAAQRGQAMSALAMADVGAMAAVAEKPYVVRKIIEPFQDELAISNYNSPKQTVVSGTAAAIERLVALCEERRLRCTRLPVSHAFHSSMVAPAAEAFAKKVRKFSLQPLHGTVISTAFGRQIREDDDLYALLGDQIRLPVRFTEAVHKASEANPALWLEIGPGGILSRLVKENLGNEIESLPTDIPGQEGSQMLNTLLGRAFVLGFPLKRENLFAYRFHRPFPLFDYDPIFITNPCERPVDLQQLPVEPLLNTWASAMVPPGIEPSEFHAYVEQRQSFLREFMAMDFRNLSKGLPLATGKPHTSPPAPAPQQSASKENIDKGTILAFAIDWIAKRTGFPSTSILPKMRLREDLNLDSIKVGELAIVLGRKFKGKFSSEHSSYMNAPLEKMIEGLQITHGDKAASVHKNDAAVHLRPEANIPDHVRTFRLAPQALPLEEENVLPPFERGSALILGATSSPQAKAIADALAGVGLSPVLTEANNLQRATGILNDLSALILIPPETERPFFACGSDEFDQRVEGLVADLFRVFKWVQQRDGGYAGLRCAVLRPVSLSRDSGIDLEAGAALLKTLSLEQPEATLKWLALPLSWSAEHWARVVVDELRTGSSRVRYHYTEAGIRMGEVAKPLHHAAKAPLNLDATDTVLVTGGAKGITCELALALARRTGAKFALVGSSPLPGPETKPEENEILRNIRRFEEQGARVLYLQADVVNLADLKDAVHQASLELGPVTAIIHGAGVSQLKLFREMDVTASVRNIRVKTRGLYNLLQVVPPHQLKALHVVSSILGLTGMQGQADYTFANAWLNGALTSLETAYSNLHCLALGYSVWSKIGLGEKLGAVESLRTRGVTALGSTDGIKSYLRLLDYPRQGTTFLITGRMTPELEVALFAPRIKPAGRFLERILRWIPGGEIVADATLKWKTDLYLPEHVIEGTTVFPGVMAVEAMVEAAQTCIDRRDLPVMRSIRFKRPLIIPEGEEVTIRMMAVAVPVEGGSTRVKVAVRSESDGFRETHFRADCYFDLELPAGVTYPSFPLLPERLPLDPETLSPVPFFQGKFFRRISGIHQIEPGKESIAEITVPQNEAYYRDKTLASPVTGSPAARDAFLQTGGLILPPGFLPAEMAELRFHETLIPGAKVFCHVEGRQVANEVFGADIAVFSEDGVLLETMKDLILETPRIASRSLPNESASPLAVSVVAPELRLLLPDTPHVVSFLEHAALATFTGGREITTEERARIEELVPEPRRRTVLANLVAARRATTQFAQLYHGLDIAPTHVFLEHGSDGKPELRFEKNSYHHGLKGLCISISDSAGLSVALVGPSPVGIDLELVKRRDAETWLGLLGEDGYDLARRLVRVTGEPFDRNATRVWTLIEAGKKASSLERILPTHSTHLEGPWYSFTPTQGSGSRDFFCATLSTDRDILALTVAMNAIAQAGYEKSKRLVLKPITGTDTVAEKRLGAILASFFERLVEVQTLFIDDPEDQATEEHYQFFFRLSHEISGKLKEVEQELPIDLIRQHQHQFIQNLHPFITNSAVFRRALEKPFGYPGDHLMMELLFNRDIPTRGLGYHFDRMFMSSDGSEAVRQRSYWAIEKLGTLLQRKAQKHLALLDLNFGPMEIEKALIAKANSGQTFMIRGMDYDERSIEHAKFRLANPRVELALRQQNLVSPPGIAEIQREVAEVDVCLCMGLIEYLDDEVATTICEAVYRGSRPGTVFLTSNYLPDHASRSLMEWFLDWWLVYRTEADLRRVICAAGFDEKNIRTTMDPTGSIVLLEVTR